MDAVKNIKGKRIYKKKTQWNVDEESLLITLWAAHIVKLRGSRKNSHIYQEISKGLEANGFYFNPEEVRVKIHNLTNKYKEERKKVGPSGGSPSSWQFYARIHSILGTYKSNSIELIMDESIEIPSTSSSSIITDLEIEPCDFLDDIAIDTQTDISVDTPPPKKKRRSNFQTEVLQKIQESTDIIKQEIEKHAEIDSKMLKLQEDLIEIERERN